MRHHGGTKRRFAHTTTKRGLPGATGNLRAAAFRFVLAVPMAALLWLYAPTGVAHAGIIDKVKTMFELPEKVDDLQQQYNNTVEQLDEATRLLEGVKQESIDAVRRYEETERLLREENNRLAEQNEKLAQAVNVLQNAERERAAQYRRTWTMIWTAAGLVALYFAMSRLFRLFLRGRRI